ncbi:type III-B CRISPR module RAMP protein Cmr4 [Tolypothrix sp. PCC 7910]|nr:type III-B CRISPR module RAMP protein Cmr4 [Tolypothrix sp. PCC 7910]
MNNYLSYLYLLTPLHTGATSNEGNLMGIAREVHTELPYIPSSSIRGKIRSTMEAVNEAEADSFFGKRIKNDNQPTEGEVWFADATLLLFPIASFSHQYLWITCPLWLSRWNRWLQNQDLTKLIEEWRLEFQNTSKKAIASVTGEQVFLQGAILNEEEITQINATNKAMFLDIFKDIPDGDGILNIKDKLLILADQDCAALVEIGLQREVKITLETDKKIVDSGSFRSQEAIPSETVLFFPWGMKVSKYNLTQTVRKSLLDALNDRLQFGGLEGLGRGWTETKTVELINSPEKKEEN